MKRIDFEHGTVTGNILGAALPMLVAQILNLLYNIVDRIYIARIPNVGTAALGAVGLCFPLIVVITAFSNLFGSGGAPLFSIYRGKNESQKSASIMNTSFTMVVACAVVLMLIGFLFARPLLVVFGASKDALVYAYPYFMIYLIGTLPSMIATGMNPFINAQGYSTIGMTSIAVGAIANLLLDPLFIFALGFGVQGAAIATVISQFLSAAFVLFFLTKKSELKVRFLKKDEFAECTAESIHLCDYPKANEAHVDKELEADMDLVLKVVVLGRACRNSGNMKNRQPLANMFVKAPFTLNEFFKDIIADELNIKTVTFTDDVRSFTTYTFKPQLRTVGPKYGKLLGKIRTALSSVDGNATMDELKANGSVTFDFDGEKVVLTEEDLLIDMTQKEGYVTESNQDVTVVLDCNLTPELLEEGFVREIISKIQTMRKEAGFEVTDHITVGYKDNVKIETIFSKYADEICADVLADKLTDSEISGYTKEWSINGETVVLTVSKE